VDEMRGRDVRPPATSMIEQGSWDARAGRWP
jgi:hypothetical protein